MRLDEIQAMLCAIVSSPAPVLPSVWLPEALGKGLMTPKMSKCSKRSSC